MSEQIRKEMITLFAIGMVLVFVGYIVYMMLMPTFTYPLPSDYFQRMNIAFIVMLGFMGIGGFINLLGFIKLIDYYKSKDN